MSAAEEIRLELVKALLQRQQAQSLVPMPATEPPRLFAGLREQVDALEAIVRPGRAGS